MKRALQDQYAEMTLGGEAIRAFIPSPLPPVPPLDPTGEREALVERATLAIGRLDSVGILLPTPSSFYFAYVRKEAVLSSQIEGHNLPSRTCCSSNSTNNPASRSTTSPKAMGRLVELGIARELTGQHRNRVFAYDAYLGILSEGSEPL